MGLDAYVACTCFRDGVTSEPPIPRSLIVVGPTGRPETVWDQDPDELVSDAQLDVSVLFHDWTDSACAHPFMELVSERIGNVMGVAWLRAVASGLDPGRFGRLTEILEGLSGMMDDLLPADEARAALPELEALLRESVIGSTRVLHELDGSVIDDELDSRPIDYVAFRSLGPSPGFRSEFDELVELGVEGYDFVVRSRGAVPGELFRARLVNQVWDHASASGPVTKYDDPIGLVTFTNVETGEEITVRSFGVRTRMRWPDGSLWDEEKGAWLHYPEGFMVGERKRMVPELWWVLSSLHRLFLAADQTGNPVVWC
ncbi:hypothetical protein [Granulicoccus phenolivorans]|uniref:hypothetical protein n=1 Tax=Granulicoccus phenolivorans TaxID=266854 RepID=UPI0011AE6967|nr:hypothetical protein [Granulicoccus phenolivorans]